MSSNNDDSFSIGPDMSEEDVEAVLLSGDPDAIARLEALANGEEVAEAANSDDPEDADEPGDDGDKEKPADETTTEQPKAEKETGSKAQSPGAEAEGEDGKPDESEKERWIETKSGKGKIPYGVLDGERKENAQLREQIRQLQEQMEGRVDREQLGEALAKKGIDLDEVVGTQKGELDPAILEDIDELDPSLGKVVRHLLERNQHQTEVKQESQLPPGVDPVVEMAVQQNQSLVEWRDSDIDKWKTACLFDSQLENDPNWSSKPLAARYAEAERMTRVYFGDDNATNEDATSKKVTAALKAAEEETIPRSLTDIGQSSPKDSSLIERMATMSASQISDELERMSTAQREAFLDSVEL